MRSLSFRSSALALLALAAASATARPAAAQIAGTTQSPLPNVLLLVDTSGSMERMVDGSLPEDNAATTCNPGTYTAPNKWGMLVQALTGNIQPFYSCKQTPRATTGLLAKEYQINGKAPYDAGYSLDYHRPLAGGSTTTGSQCVYTPWKLPSASAGGVGPTNSTMTGAQATDFPDEALANVNIGYLESQLSGGQSLPSVIPSSNACVFSQGNDGQLDAARDYVRFALMTFDNDTGASMGVPPASQTAGVFSTSNTLDGADPFGGLWSYVRHSGNPYYNPGSCTGGTTCTNATTLGGQGAPGTTPACSAQPWEVGARNEAAPPWEGRLVPFPPKYASLFDLERQNEQIQKVLLSSRPYGATPIDAMFDDARDYLWYYDNGPGKTGTATYDPYECRERYVVLLTDGAPNLDMRPACTATNGICPYPATASDIAHDMVTATSPRKVKTFVIGFAVAGDTTGGDGFPPALPVAQRNCKGWYEDASGGNNSAVTMNSVCSASPPAAGTTAAACCKLNEIALAGSNDGVSTPVGAFFAESQADIVFAFGKIVANILRAATTRTVPAYTPTAQYSNDSLSSTGVTTSAQFLASFIPSSQRPWSGELDRTRFQCDASLTSVPQAETAAAGDLMSVNLATQSSAAHRLVLSVLANKIGGKIDSAASVRPFANPSSPTTSFTGGDGITSPDGSTVTYGGREVAMTNVLSFETDWPLALRIDNTTCTRGRAATSSGSGTEIVPALDGPSGAQKCTDVVWGFATAFPGAQTYTGTPSTAVHDFNVRCKGGASKSSSAGKCAISGDPCTVGNIADCTSGDTCIPECSALGAIFHSNPSVVGPPNDFLREEGFRTFESVRRGRQAITYVATTDGLLHAFKSLDSHSDYQELWAFVPPAVLPNLKANYPAGNQILLDGSPVIGESIWERRLSDTIGTNAAKQWHTTLVAGMGAGGAGYYALNVTDGDCSRGRDAASAAADLSSCVTGYQQPSAGGLISEVANGGVVDGTTKVGPHFLWQLTDVPEASSGSETAKNVRNSNIGAGSGAKMYALFGKHTSTPAIGMVQIKVGGEERQVGIAVLPGGYEDAPVTGGTCARLNPTPAMPETSTRGFVRQWASSCTAPVPGRSVTVVRLDTGEIIKHFARLTDTPLRVQPKTKNTPFDSPMTGTPVLYPAGVGVPAQKIFVGDADGTLWRIDVSNTDPANWSASLFHDMAYTQSATEGQPINVAPVVSTDEAGNVVINAATGEQDSIVVNPSERDFVYSLTEKRDSSNQIRAHVNWYLPLPAAERVTGPMVVFDRTLYFATYQPFAPTGATCGLAGQASLWGLDYQVPNPLGASQGGAPRWCPAASVDTVTGLCNSPTGYVQRETQTDGLIPGVSLRTSSACTSVTSTPTDEIGTGAFSAVNPVQYSLNFGVSDKHAGSPTGSPQAARGTSLRQLPRNATRIDSWSLVIE